MNRRTLIIEPRDPVIFRDGKPFDLGLVSSSLPFATPAAVIGSARTRLGAGTDYKEEDVRRLLRVQQVGPLLAYQHWSEQTWHLAVPAPADALAYEPEETLHDKHAPLEIAALTPSANSTGSDLPPGVTALQGARDSKTSKRVPHFWTWAAFAWWLDRTDAGPWRKRPLELGFPALPRHRRVHVSITPATQTAEEGMLFATEGLEFQSEGLSTESRVRFALATQLYTEDATPLPAVSHIGGEGRTAFWREMSAAELEWPAPPMALTKATQVRLILLTPGLFQNGWRPAWFDGDGFVPGTKVALELVSAAVSRPLPLSGWDLQNKGAKATRFMAPAGSVYFCRVKSGDPRELWMRAVSDNEQDQRDGYGIVALGEWK